MSSTVIDCHGQVGSGETWADSGVTRWVDYKVELLLQRAAEAGIDRTCIMVPQNATYADKNREIADLCAGHPDKLIGFAVHSPQRETGRLREMLLEEVRSMGLKGVKSDGHPTRELLDVVAELKIPVMYSPEDYDHWPGKGHHVGARYLALNVIDAAEPPAAGYHMMVMAYPSVNFILPHLGSYRSDPWWAHIDAINLAKRYSNVYIETSGVLSHRYLVMAAQELPAEKLLFGSYSTELDPRVEIYAAKLLKLPGAKEAQVLGGNTRRLFGV